MYCWLTTNQDKLTHCLTDRYTCQTDECQTPCTGESSGGSGAQRCGEDRVRWESWECTQRQGSHAGCPGPSWPTRSSHLREPAPSPVAPCGSRWGGWSAGLLSRLTSFPPGTVTTNRYFVRVSTEVSLPLPKKLAHAVACIPLLYSSNVQILLAAFVSMST